MGIKIHIIFVGGYQQWIISCDYDWIGGCYQQNKPGSVLPHNIPIMTAGNDRIFVLSLCNSQSHTYCFLALVDMSTFMPPDQIMLIKQQSIWSLGPCAWVIIFSLVVACAADICVVLFPFCLRHGWQGVRESTGAATTGKMPGLQLPVVIIAVFCFKELPQEMPFQKRTDNFLRGATCTAPCGLGTKYTTCCSPTGRGCLDNNQASERFYQASQGLSCSLENSWLPTLQLIFHPHTAYVLSAGESYTLQLYLCNTFCVYIYLYLLQRLFRYPARAVLEDGLPACFATALLKLNKLEYGQYQDGVSPGNALYQGLPASSSTSRGSKRQNTELPSPAW